MPYNKIIVKIAKNYSLGVAIQEVALFQHRSRSGAHMERIVNFRLIVNCMRTLACTAVASLILIVLHL